MAASLIVACGCSNTGHQGDTAIELLLPGDADQRTFVVASATTDNNPPQWPQDTTVTIEVSKSRNTGQHLVLVVKTDCNTINVPFDADGARGLPQVDEIATTAMACGPSPESDAEAWLLQFFSDPFSITPNQNSDIVLTSDSPSGQANSLTMSALSDDPSPGLDPSL